METCIVQAKEQYACARDVNHIIDSIIVQDHAAYIVNQIRLLMVLFMKIQCTVNVYMVSINFQKRFFQVSLKLDYN